MAGKSPDASSPSEPPAFAVGLTGGIGSGKTAVAGIFARHGAAIIDSDAIAPAVGSAAFRLLNNSESSYAAIPGYRLLFQSRSANPSRDPVIRYRLYELVSGDEAASAAGATRAE